MANTRAPQRLYLMEVASLIPPGVPVVCYLVQTGDGHNILIDSGVAPHTPLPFGPSPTIGKNVVEQLAMIGLKPEAIDTFICTHFDPDHSGFNDSFPNAEFIVQRRHYDMAKRGNPRTEINRSHWDQPHLRYRFVDGDTELLPGLELIATDGHVTGHQSVVITLPETGVVVPAIDAVVRQILFTPDRPATPLDENEAEVKISARKLIDLAKARQAALVVFGHDADQWKVLKKLPEFYG